MRFLNVQKLSECLISNLYLIALAAKDVEKEEHSPIADKIGTWDKHKGIQSGDSSLNGKGFYEKKNVYHSGACMPNLTHHKIGK